MVKNKLRQETLVQKIQKTPTVLNFNLDQPLRLHPNVGSKQFIWTEKNKSIFTEAAKDYYLPTLETLGEALFRNPHFKFNLGMSGTFLEQAKAYSPSLMYLLKDLTLMGTKKGQLELLGETYYNSLAEFFKHSNEFKQQIQQHRDLLKEEFGITPIIYAPKNADYPTIDENLSEEAPDIEVIRRPIFNPQDFLPKRTSKSSGVANINKGGLLSWIRGNVFIPDAKIFWVSPSVKFLKKYLKEQDIDVLISSGPPHSMHLIANKLKQLTSIKWIADFRDPWTTLYYTENFNLSDYAKRKNERLETKILQNADIVLTVSKTIQEELQHKAKQVEVITNGYDDEVLGGDYQLDTKFSMAHIGLLPSQSNPKLLWAVLRDLCTEIPQFKQDLEINLTGNVSEETIETIKNSGLDSNLKLTSYVSHKKAIELQRRAQVLLLLIPNTKNSKGILTGKVFEYITSKRPILAIGNTQGDLAEILEHTQTGTLIDFNDKVGLKSAINSYYKAYLEGKLMVNAQHIEQYHR